VSGLRWSCYSLRPRKRSIQRFVRREHTRHVRLSSESTITSCPRSASYPEMLNFHCQDSAAAHHRENCAWSNEPNNAVLSNIRSATRLSLLSAAAVADSIGMQAMAEVENNAARSPWSCEEACLVSSSRGRNHSSQAWGLRRVPVLPP
jgi:hypothetical protein